MVSPGLVADLAIGTLKENGFNAEAEPTRMFHSFQQEKNVEALVSKKTICIVNGIKDYQSALDSILSQNATYTLDGSKYTLKNGIVVRQDFKITNQLQRTTSGQIKYTSVCDDILEFFPTLISPPDATRKFY